MTWSLEILSLRIQSCPSFGPEFFFNITRWISLSSDSYFSYKNSNSATSKICFENLDRLIWRHLRIIDDLTSYQVCLYATRKSNRFVCRTRSPTVRNVSRLIFLKWRSQYRYCQRIKYCNASNSSSYSSNTDRGIIRSPSNTKSEVILWLHVICFVCIHKKWTRRLAVVDQIFVLLTDLVLVSCIVNH